MTRLLLPFIVEFTDFILIFFILAFDVWSDPSLYDFKLNLIFFADKLDLVIKIGTFNVDLIDSGEDDGKADYEEDSVTG